MSGKSFFSIFSPFCLSFGRAYVFISLRLFMDVGVGYQNAIMDTTQHALSPRTTGPKSVNSPANPRQDEQLRSRVDRWSIIHLMVPAR